MNGLSELEIILLNGLVEKYPSLKSHIPYLKVKDRKITGVGMYVNFEYVNSAGKIKIEEIEALFSNEENIAVKSLKYGLGYVIDIIDGEIKYIEFVTYGENWDGIFGDYKIIKE